MSYTDDLATIISGKNYLTILNLLQKALELVLNWCLKHGSSIKTNSAIFKKKKN